MRSAQVELDDFYAELGAAAAGGGAQPFQLIAGGVEAGDRGALYQYARLLLSGSPGLGLEPDPQAAVPFLLRARGLRSEPAALDLCRGFAAGVFAPAGDLPSPGGFLICRNLAYAGVREAIALTGDLYMLGRGVERNLVDAELYYQLAADAGSGRGARMLGDFSLARGGVVNVREALAHYIRAVELGDDDALLSAAAIFETGPEDMRSPARAFALWQLGSQRGSTAAAWGLARAFNCGIGVAPSPVEATYWYNTAIAAPAVHAQAEALYGGGCG